MSTCPTAPAAGISNVEALDAVAAAMRSVVTRPMGKGEVSTQLTALMDPPYLRFCRPCNSTHLYEMPFRLTELRAGAGAGGQNPILGRPGAVLIDGAIGEQAERLAAYRQVSLAGIDLDGGPT